MLKIRTKITLVSTVLYSFLLIVIGYFAVNDTVASFSKIYDTKLENIYSDIEEKIKFSVDNKYVDKSFFASLKNYSNLGVDIQIYNDKLELLSNPVKNFAYDEFDENLKGERQSFIDADDEIDHRHYYYNFKSINSGGQEFILAGRILASELEFEYYKHELFFVLGIPVYVLIVTLVSFQISKASFKPIVKIINKSKEITSSNLNTRIEVSEPEDEIRELGLTINEMIARLEKSFLSQKNFVANASHEIRTPLTIIKADLQNLRDDINDEEKKEEINKTIEELDKLTNLSKSLMELSKLETGEKEFTEIRIDEILIESTQVFYRSAANKNILFNINFDGDLTIEGDKIKIASAINNLIDNAIKYSEENKIIDITARVSKEKKVVISILDRGFGIKEENVEKIFERFFRSDEYRAGISGSGLGLSIVSEIIKTHKGEIYCKSKLGKGTEFIIYLPLKQV